MRQHAGGPCPAEPGSIVRIRYRNGREAGPIKAESRRWERWSKPPLESDWDIVAWEFAGAMK